MDSCTKHLAIQRWPYTICCTVHYTGQEQTKRKDQRNIDFADRPHIRPYQCRRSNCTKNEYRLSANSIRQCSKGWNRSERDHIGKNQNTLKIVLTTDTNAAKITRMTFALLLVNSIVTGAFWDFLSPSLNAGVSGKVLRTHIPTATTTALKKKGMRHPQDNN